MKNYFTIALLLVASIASYYLLKQLQKDLIDDSGDTLVKTVGTAYEVDARYFNANNQLQYKLRSPKISELSAQNGTHLSAPKLTVYDVGQIITWLGYADKAFLTGDKQHLTLTDNVKIIESPAGDKPIHIDGSIMYYDAKTRHVTSDKMVTIDDATVKQTSDYLLLDTVTRQLVVEKKVKANYHSLEIPKRHQRIVNDEDEHWYDN